MLFHLNSIMRNRNRIFKLKHPNPATMSISFLHLVPLLWTTLFVSFQLPLILALQCGADGWTDSKCNSNGFQYAQDYGTDCGASCDKDKCCEFPMKSNNNVNSSAKVTCGSDNWTDAKCKTFEYKFAKDKITECENNNCDKTTCCMGLTATNNDQNSADDKNANSKTTCISENFNDKKCNENKFEFAKNLDTECGGADKSCSAADCCHGEYESASIRSFHISASVLLSVVIGCFFH